MTKIERIYQCLIAILIFLIPSNLFLKFLVDSAYVNGLLVDYLLPKLYVSDLPILLMLGIWIFELVKKRAKLPSKYLPLIMLLLMFSALQFLTAKPFAAIWFLGKLIEIGIFVIFLWQHKHVLENPAIMMVPLMIAIIFQSSLAIYQFQTQHSFSSSYLFLGEPNLSHVIGLKKGEFDVGLSIGEKVIPYGTTAHPNILAGFLVVGILLIMRQKKLTKFLKWPVIVIATYALYLTQSESAWASLALGLGILFASKFRPFKYKNLMAIIALFLAPIFVHLLAIYKPENLSYVRRDQLNQAAISMFSHNLVTGVGLNNFTANLEKYNHSAEIVRFIQPAHNIAMLWLAETGLFALASLGLALYLLRKNLPPMSPLIYALLPIAALDHYLLSQQTGLLLLVLIFIGSYLTNGDTEERSNGTC